MSPTCRIAWAVARVHSVCSMASDFKKELNVSNTPEIPLLTILAGSSLKSGLFVYQIRLMLTTHIQGIQSRNYQ